MLAIGLLILLVMRRAVCSALEGKPGRQVWGFALACAGAAIAGLVVYIAGNWAMTHLGGAEM